MPSRMNELECLQTLSNFIVGKSNGSSLKDLKNLKFIGGELHISRLENTYNSNADQDIREAILIDKEYLEVLILEWGSQFDESRNEVAEKYVLDMLKPHRNLIELTIKCYGGRNFPSWVGDPSVLSNLTVLRLESCYKCEALPPLGLLGSLKDLTIKGMRGLKRIGSETYGEDCSMPFKSLKSLSFEDLQEWEHWDPISENQDVQIFSCLCKLSIVNCPKLFRILSNHIPSLENLEIYKCEQLTVLVDSLPSLRKLKVIECLQFLVSARSGVPMLSELEISKCRRIIRNSSTDFTSLKSVILSKISKFRNIDRSEQVTNLCGNEYEMICFEQIGQPLSSLTFLRELCISDCPSLISFPEADFFSFLNKLDISYCRALTSLPEGTQHSIARLQHLEIAVCNSLTHIFRDQLPSSLQRLSVSQCDNLRCLFSDRKDTGTSSVVQEENIISNTNTSLLETLQVFGCHSLTCLCLRGQLPVSLKYLYLSGCSMLTTLSSGPLPFALKRLSVEYCTELTTLSRQLPQTVEYLIIRGCSKLESIAQMFHTNSSLDSIKIFDCENLKSLPDGLHKLSSLRSIYIGNCSSLVSFPEGGLPNTNLIYCVNLKALPNRVNSLNSLRQLHIYQCPNIISFPEEGFPTQLEKLKITQVSDIYQQLIRWGLHKLTSLRLLQISGCSEAESFPPEDMRMMLPTSLTHLIIVRFPKLKKLYSQGFQNLSSLEVLSIWNCPNLKSFPKLGLPSSLLQLDIMNCPLLEKRYKMVQRNNKWSKVAHIPLETYKTIQRKEWSKIAHIPLISFDGKFIDN